MNEQDYGQLTKMVVTATALMAAAGAIIKLFRRGGKWEPLQENFGDLSRKVGALVTAVVVGLMWANLRQDKSMLNWIGVSSIVLLLICTIIYSYLTGKQTYKKIVVKQGKPVERKIIGGFSLTDVAKSNMAQAPQRVGREITVQEYYEGTQYNEELVWSRSSLEYAKSLFILGYVGLIVSGAIALSAVALRMILEGETTG
jgi:hypothetical protein